MYTLTAKTTEGDFVHTHPTLAQAQADAIANYGPENGYVYGYLIETQNGYGTQIFDFVVHPK